MKIFKRCADLLNDIESFSNQQNVPAAEALIRKARTALNEDLRNLHKQLSNAQESKNNVQPYLTGPM